MTAIDEQVSALLDQLNPGERRLAEVRLAREQRRRDAMARFPTTGHLAKFVHPDTVQTPLTQALDRVVLQCDTGMDTHWLVSCPPQEGKSRRMAVVAPLHLLIRDPSRRIVVASYEQGLASRSTLEVRQLIEAYGGGYKGEQRHSNQRDYFGLLLDPDHALQTNWSLADSPGRRNGGMVAVGVGSAFTGRSADVLIIDDPVKDAKQADSPGQRKAIVDWYRAVATTRLSPRAIVIVIQTRWHEDDLMGWLLREDRARATPRWSKLIVPAQAGAGDPLGRQPGEYLRSARGRTAADWEETRAAIGERWWHALYQANPSPPEGGIFQRGWFDRNRVSSPPELGRVEVFVDPADNTGDGDEAGIVVAGKAADSDDLYLLADLSDNMTVARWVRVAILAAVRHRAVAIAYEQSLSQLRARAASVWKDMLREARRLEELWQATAMPDQPWPAQPSGRLLTAAVESLSRDDDTPAERASLEVHLLELWPLVPEVLLLPVSGVPLRKIVPQGSKTFRAEMTAPLFETGVAHVVGHLVELEHQMVSWQHGQDSPDRMDAAVHALTELGAGLGPVELVGASGPDLPLRSARHAIPRAGSVGGRR